MTKSLSLLDEAAACMGCLYLSDLHYLTPYQRCVLAVHLEKLDVANYTLFQWNDALEYLSGHAPETTANNAKNKLLRSLRKL